MAKIKCAISGITYSVPHIAINLTNREVAHPIFYLTQSQLLDLYTSHMAGKLSNHESYLLFLSLLHSTDHIVFSHTILLDPANITTIKIISENIVKLVRVIWQTDLIVHPSFKQPSYIIRAETARLEQIASWIESWKQNLNEFHLNQACIKDQENLVKLENKLTYYTNRGIEDTSLARIVAKWADVVGAFPANKSEEYKKVIINCFNEKAMFNTSKALILEVIKYCEDNILADSSHFHRLLSTLRTGYNNHNSYLDLDYSLSEIALEFKNKDFTLCVNDSDLESSKLIASAKKAPPKKPVESEYPTKSEYLRAKLSYRLAARILNKGH